MFTGLVLLLGTLNARTIIDYGGRDPSVGGYENSQDRRMMDEIHPLIVGHNIVELLSAACTIVGGEYFVGRDPGAGEGVPFTTSGGGGDAELVIDIPVAELGLQMGVNTISVRYRDDCGVWGLIETRLFFLEEGEDIRELVAAEYFLGDDDPGEGNGIPVDVARGQSVSLYDNILLPELDTGITQISIRFQDDTGSWGPVASRDMTIAVPSLDRVEPSSGGNIGDVTLMIHGSSFDSATSVYLFRNGSDPIHYIDTLFAILGGDRIMATFDLRGQDVGVYDVIVELGDGEQLTLPQSFEILPGVAAQPWSDIVGLDQIRVRQWQSFTVVYGNSGNVDAVGVPLWIQLPENIEYVLDVDFVYPEIDTVPLDSVPISYVVDSINGKPQRARFISVIIPFMRGGETGSFTFNIRTQEEGLLELRTWTSPPMYRSPTWREYCQLYSRDG